MFVHGSSTLAADTPGTDRVVRSERWSLPRASLPASKSLAAWMAEASRRQPQQTPRAYLRIELRGWRAGNRHYQIGALDRLGNSIFAEYRGARFSPHGIRAEFGFSANETKLAQVSAVPTRLLYPRPSGGRERMGVGSDRLSVLAACGSSATAAKRKPNTTCDDERGLLPPQPHLPRPKV